MNAPPASWSQPASRDPARCVTAGLAIAAFVAVWVLIHHGFYRHSQIVDTPIYQRYGDAIAKGQVPYRDFALEYPPGALPAFVIPSLLAPGTNGATTGDGFEAEMVVCGALASRSCSRSCSRLEAGPVRTFGALAFAALAPLLIGSVVLSRFDLWPAALDGRRAGGARLGPRPPRRAARSGWRSPRRSTRGARPVSPSGSGGGRAGARRSCASVSSAACCSRSSSRSWCSSPHGVWHSVTAQTSRPLQIETLGAGVLLVAARGRRARGTMRSSHGSQNLAGGGPDALAVCRRSLQAAALIAVWVWFARGPADPRAARARVAAAVCAFVAFGKVLSPQFLIWLVPLVPLVRGRRGLAAGGLLAAALVLTQLWFPFRYWELVLRLRDVPVVDGAARDLLLVALFAVLVPCRRRRPATRSASIAVARPSASQSTTTPSSRTPPSAGGTVWACPCACGGSPGRPRRRSPSRAGRSSRRR